MATTQINESYDNLLNKTDINDLCIAGKLKFSYNVIYTIEFFKSVSNGMEHRVFGKELYNISAAIDLLKVVKSKNFAEAEYWKIICTPQEDSYEKSYN